MIRRLLRQTRILLAIAAFPGWLATPTAAQSAGGVIAGRVVDPSGRFVPAAEIRLISQDTQDARAVRSSFSGEFVFTPVEPGVYTLTVKAAGFKQYEQRNLQLFAAGRVSAGDLKLEVGPVTESVEVRGASAIVQTTSSGRSQTLDANQLMNLPTFGRDYLGMIAVMPGVVSNTDGSAALGVFSSPAAMSGVTGSHNSVSVDGISGNTRGGGNLDTPVNLDSVAEVKVLTNTYQAEYGKGGGSVINVVTKSGGKVFHGSLYYLGSGTNLNANSFFNNRQSIPKDDTSYQTLGGNLGGPIYWPKKFNTRKDKLFFFLSTETLPNQIPAGQRAFTVPTSLERNGNFSQSQDVNNQLIVVKDPLNGGAPFPGGIVPANRIDPNMQKLLNIFPMPNQTNRVVTASSYNFVALDSPQTPNAGVDKAPVSQLVLRVDDYVSSKLRFYFRGMDMHTHNKGLTSTTNLMTWGIGDIDYATHGPNLGGTVTYMASPTLVNEFTIGYALWAEEQLFDQSTYLPQVQRSKLGVTLGQFYPANNPLDLIPAMQFGGIPDEAVTGFTARFPLRTDASSWTLSDSISKVWHKHLFKAGVQGERAIYNQYHNGNSSFSGSFDFTQSNNNPLDTGYAYSNALLGYFLTYTEGTSRTDSWPVTPILEFFVQDSWSVSRRVTLDLGVRFTAGFPQYPANSAAANFVPALFNATKAPVLYRPVLVAGAAMAQNPLTGAILPKAYEGLIVPGSGDTSNGTVVAGASGWPAGMVDFQGILPAPRLGFAWDVMGNGRMAIRGGFGIAYNPREGSGTLGDLSGNPPLIYNPQEVYGTTATFLSVAGTQGVSSFTRTLQRNQQPPAAYNWSLGVQRDIGFSTVLDVAYVGSYGRHIQQSLNINEVPYGSRFLMQNQDPTNPGLPLNDNFFRPYAGWGNITLDAYRGNSSYHSLQAQARRRMARGMFFGVAYTWSKAMDDGISVATYLPNRPWAYEESSYDRTNVFAANYLWELPGLSHLVKGGFIKAAFDGWQITGITRFQSGAPLNMAYLGTANLISGADLTGGGDGWRPVMLSNPVLPKSQRSFTRYFNANAFTVPNQAFPYGNAPSTFARGPGVNNWNLSLMKRFHLSEKVRLIFTGSAFNAFNHTQFSGVGVTPKFDAGGAQVNPQFGQVTSARAPRTLEVGLRLVF